MLTNVSISRISCKLFPGDPETSSGGRDERKALSVLLSAFCVMRYALSVMRSAFCVKRLKSQSHPAHSKTY